MSKFQQVEFETAVAIFRCGGEVWWDYGGDTDDKAEVIASLREEQVDKHASILRTRTYYIRKTQDVSHTNI